VSIDGEVELITGRGNSSRSSGKAYACLYFPERLRYPANKTRHKAAWVDGDEHHPGATVDTADFSSRRYTFRLSLDQDDHQFLRITSRRARKRWERDLEFRACDALELVTGQAANWYFAELQFGSIEECHIRSVKRFGDDGRINPPVMNIPTMFEDTWRLFGLYLEAMCDKRLNDSVGRRLRSMRAPAYWGAKLLAAGVQIEGVLSDNYDKHVKPPDDIVEAVGKVFGFLDSDESIASGMKDRIRTSLGLLKSRSSAENKLKALAGYGVVMEEYIEAWRHIRNKSAHADLQSTGVSDDNLKRYHQVLVLFYQLIFYLVGYKGRYVDYGKEDHPIASYPPGSVSGVARP
jgi:hypothetical protein